MSDIVSTKMQDPEACAHRWELLLNMVGRRVELWCPMCLSNDQDIWPPGGIADLVTYQIPAAGIRVTRADHTAKHLTAIPVHLQVNQIASITRSGGSFSLETGTRVVVTPREP